MIPLPAPEPYGRSQVLVLLDKTFSLDGIHAFRRQQGHVIKLLLPAPCLPDLFQFFSVPGGVDGFQRLLDGSFLFVGQIEEHAAIVIMKFPGLPVECRDFRLLKQFFDKKIFRIFPGLLRQNACLIKPLGKRSPCNEHHGGYRHNSAPESSPPIAAKGMIHPGQPLFWRKRAFLPLPGEVLNKKTAYASQGFFFLGQ